MADALDDVIARVGGVTIGNTETTTHSVAGGSLAHLYKTRGIPLGFVRVQTTAVEDVFACALRGAVDDGCELVMFSLCEQSPHAAHVPGVPSLPAFWASNARAYLVARDVPADTRCVEFVFAHVGGVHVTRVMAHAGGSIACAHRHVSVSNPVPQRSLCSSACVPFEGTADALAWTDGERAWIASFGRVPVSLLCPGAQCITHACGGEMLFAACSDARVHMLHYIRGQCFEAVRVVDMAPAPLQELAHCRATHTYYRSSAREPVHRVQAVTGDLHALLGLHNTYIAHVDAEQIGFHTMRDGPRMLAVDGDSGLYATLSALGDVLVIDAAGRTRAIVHGSAPRVLCIDPRELYPPRGQELCTCVSCSLRTPLASLCGTDVMIAHTDGCARVFVLDAEGAVHETPALLL